jgi:hypothetical protein
MQNEAPKNARTSGAGDTEQALVRVSRAERHAARGQDERRRERQRGERQHDGEQRVWRARVEPSAGGEHAGDEAHRAPQPDRAVALRASLERAERERLDDRQRARREQAHRQHERGDRRRALGPGQQRVAGEQHAGGEHHDAARRAAAVGEPAPEGRGRHARELRHRQHRGDLARAEAARREVQREIRHERADVQEVGEEIRRQSRRGRHRDASYLGELRATRAALLQDRHAVVL